MHYKETKYGFEWGPVKVRRLISDRGWVVLGISTPYQELQVYSSATGRSVRTNQRKKAQAERLRETT